MVDTLVKSYSSGVIYPQPNIIDPQTLSLEMKSIEDLFKMITKSENPPFSSYNPESVIQCMALSPDEIYLITGSMSGEIQIWNTHSFLTPPKTWSFNSPIKTLLIEGFTIYAGTDSGKVLKWDFVKNTQSSFRDIKSSINTLAILPDKSLALGSALFELEIWAEGPKPIRGEGHEDEITCMKIGKERRIFTASADRSLRVWDYCDGLLDQLRFNEEVHKDGIICMEILENTLVTGDHGGLLVVWNQEDIECLSKIHMKDPLECFCKSVDNRYLFITTEDTESRKILILNMQNVTEKPLAIKRAHKAGIKTIIYLNSTSQLVSTSEDKNMKIWNFSKPVNESPFLTSKNIDSFALAGQNLVFSQNGSIFFLNMETREISKSLDAPMKIKKLRMGPENETFAHNSDENVLYVWRKGYREPSWKFQHPMEITSIEYLDKHSVITGCNDRLVRIWSLVFDRVDKEFSIEKPITAVKFSLKYFYVAGNDGIIRVHRRVDHSEKSRLEYQSQVYSVDCDLEDLVVAGGQSGHLKLWRWKKQGKKIKPVVLEGHKEAITKVVLKGCLVFTSDFGNTLKIWSSTLSLLYYSLKLGVDFLDYQVTPDDSELFFLSIQGIHSLQNPIKYEDPIVYPSQYSWIFIKYLQKLFANKSKVFDPYWKEYIIYPHVVNLLYVLIKANHPDLLKQAITQGVKFMQDRNGESPLSVALSWKNYHCADVILRTLAKIKLKKEFGIIDCIEKCMNKLISSNLSQLPKFFDSVFPVKTSGMVVYAKMLSKAPMILEKKNFKMYENDFVMKDSETKEQVLFRASVLKFNFEVGSFNSLMLLRAIRHSSNAELFRTDLLKSIVKYKWTKVYWILLGEAVVFFMMIAGVSYFTMTQAGGYFSLSLLLFLNLLTTIRETIQLVESPRKYFKDIWNLVDISRILGTYVFVYLKVFQVQLVFLNQVLTALYWARAVTYFRISDKTRYLIRMISETFLDIIPFLLIFFSSTVTFALLFYISTDSDHFSSTFVYSYQLNFNDFSGLMPSGYSENFSLTFWTIFFLASIMNPIILLNMLIAIMSDTYDRVQEDQIVADCKEMAGMIMQVESMMFWRRHLNKTSFIQRCDYVRDLRSGDNEWVGKIRAIKKSISRLQVKVKGNDRKLERMQGKIGMKIKEIKSINEQIAKKISELEGVNQGPGSVNSFVSTFE
jgi:WD40 repeat protein